MNRRNFLRSLFASSAAIVVAPADIFDVLPPAPGDPHHTYFDMGRAGTETDHGPWPSWIVQAGPLLATMYVVRAGDQFHGYAGWGSLP